MYSAEVLVEVLEAREALAGVALAAGMRAIQGITWAAVLTVDLALVAKKSASISESRKLLATLEFASVGSIMFVHVFTAIVISREFSRCISFSIGTYLHSHLRLKTLTSSVQLGNVHSNLPSAFL